MDAFFRIFFHHHFLFRFNELTIFSCCSKSWSSACKTLFILYTDDCVCPTMYKMQTHKSSYMGTMQTLHKLICEIYAKLEARDVEHCFWGDREAPQTVRERERGWVSFFIEFLSYHNFIMFYCMCMCINHLVKLCEVCAAHFSPPSSSSSPSFVFNRILGFMTMPFQQFPIYRAYWS